MGERASCAYEVGVSQQVSSSALYCLPALIPPSPRALGIGAGLVELGAGMGQSAFHYLAYMECLRGVLPQSVLAIEMCPDRVYLLYNNWKTMRKVRAGGVESLHRVGADLVRNAGQDMPGWSEIRFHILQSNLTRHRFGPNQPVQSGGERGAVAFSFDKVPLLSGICLS